jgi:hypothetical protein
MIDDGYLFLVKREGRHIITDACDLTQKELDDVAKYNRRSGWDIAKFFHKRLQEILQWRFEGTPNLDEAILIVYAAPERLDESGEELTLGYYCDGYWDLCDTNDLGDPALIPDEDVLCWMYAPLFPERLRHAKPAN